MSPLNVDGSIVVNWLLTKCNIWSELSLLNEDESIAVSWLPPQNITLSELSPLI